MARGAWGNRRLCRNQPATMRDRRRHANPLAVASTLLLTGGALLAEAAFGYPAALLHRVGHPVMAAGAAIAWLDAALNRGRWRRARGAAALLALLAAAACRPGRRRRRCITAAPPGRDGGPGPDRLHPAGAAQPAPPRGRRRGRPARRAAAGPRRGGAYRRAGHRRWMRPWSPVPPSRAWRRTSPTAWWPRRYGARCWGCPGSSCTRW